MTISGETHVAMKEAKTTDKGKDAKDDGKGIQTKGGVKEPEVTKAPTVHLTNPHCHTLQD